MRKTHIYLMLSFCSLVTVILGAWLLISSGSKNFSAEAQESSISVNLANEQGTVVGNYGETAWTQQRFMQFRGVPYAEAPVGALRFQPPVPRAPWSQKLEAFDYGQRCPVITNLDPYSSDEQLEDCLNLCIYTKNLTGNLPVMFYIYGGGYYNGSSSDHPPHYLLEQDVLLVVPNYRVGALGWLSTLTSEMPGNAPIADILLALTWVQEHIHIFGGDPKQVTVFGQSAGAGIASCLLLSPRSASGSFHRAIVQSGSIFASWAITKDPSEQAKRICRQLGCQECEVPSELLSCVRSVTVLQLLTATQSESFSPIVGDFHGILPQNPNELLKTYDKQVPLMTGFTEHDGSFVLASYFDALSASSNISALTVRQFSQGMISMANDTTGLTDNLVYRLLYTPQLLESLAHKSALPAYFDLSSVIFMKSPVISLATKLHTKQPAMPVYVYSFEYEGNHTRFGYEFGNDHYPFNGGVHHSNDNIYLFSTHKLEGEDTRMAQRMVEWWTSFARTGVPKGFSPLTSSSGPYNRISLTQTLGNDLLETLTATLDDPNNGRLQRSYIGF